MSENTFENRKPHLNIGTIGHVDHGKTTLTAAITKVLSSLSKETTFKAYDQIDNAPEEKTRGITISAAHVEYETEARHYSHIDCPGHADYVKNMISGASQMDAAILVISIVDGMMPQTFEHLLLAKQLGIPHVIVYINKLDMISSEDEDLVLILEEEIAEYMQNTYYGGAVEWDPKQNIVNGSAMLALEGDKGNYGEKSIHKLVELLDKIPQPARSIDYPFLLPIEDVFSVEGRGTVVTGCIEEGSVSLGDEVQITGFSDETITTSVTGIEMFHKSMEKGYAGDNVGLLLRGLKRNEVRRGQIVTHVKELTLTKTFDAQVYIYLPSEGGRTKPFFSNYTPQFFIRTADVTGCITILNTPMLNPGDSGLIKVELLSPLVINPGVAFTIREGGKTIGRGTVVVQ